MGTGEETAWAVRLTPKAVEMLAAVQDRGVRERIRDRIDGLAHDPETQGKPLLGLLPGLRSIRVGQRHRIIYKAERNTVTVVVVGVGLRREGDRRDIYELARRLVRQGLWGT